MFFAHVAALLTGGSGCVWASGGHCSLSYVPAVCRKMMATATGDMSREVELARVWSWTPWAFATGSVGVLGKGSELWAPLPTCMRGGGGHSGAEISFVLPFRNVLTLGCSLVRYLFFGRGSSSDCCVCCLCTSSHDLQGYNMVLNWKRII
jgi:hypothetical protein